ncbi:MAG: FtsX-like permease family protein [Alphaproteobacteria bacterium]|nr:FtsX-like permease family protein [Alphaproteobacteria bacterium]
MSNSAISWPLAARLARRELRGGTRGFRIFIACLALGVAAIAAVGSTRAMLEESISVDSREILGGDLLIDIVHRRATLSERGAMDRMGIVAASAEMRTMARAETEKARRTLVELKTVEDTYPLYGSLETEPQLSRATLLEQRDGVWGAAAAPALLARLDISVGDVLKIGETRFEVRAIIVHEPDRIGGSGLFSLGPRVLISDAALLATALVQPGSLIHYNYRVRLPKNIPTSGFIEELNTAFPEAGWRIRTLDESSPQLTRLIGRVTLFLSFVGLTALLVGGVGVANAVRAWLDSKTGTIATLKCIGAPRTLIFRIYLLQVMALAMLGIVAGVIVGAALPMVVTKFLAQVVPVRIAPGVFIEPLAVAALFGLLTALTFSIWSIARACDIPAGSLFRARVEPTRGLPRISYVLITAILTVALSALAIVTASDSWFALWFVLGSICAMLTFRIAAFGIAKGAARMKGIRHPALRLAVAGLYRPGAPTPSVVLSLGLGLSMLVTVATIEGNLSRQIAEELPADAPAFFFVDIQPDQLKPFGAIVAGIPGVGLSEQVPMLRGRITAIDGVRVSEATIAREARWVLRGDRGITWASETPAHNSIVTGAWWPADYAGEMLVSIDHRIASGLGLAVGETITVNILGREFTATIANTRAINWQRLAINFVMIFSPGELEFAPRMHIAVVHADETAEDLLERVVTDRFSNVTSIRVRSAIETVSALVSNVGTAVRMTTLITIVTGTLVLAGAIAAGHRRRIYDSVVLKVLGATQRDIVTAYVLEYGLLGLVTAVIAALVGTITGWAVVTWLLRIGWGFDPGAIAVTTILATFITISAGLVGTWRAMRQKAAPWLRNE